MGGKMQGLKYHTLMHIKLLSSTHIIPIFVSVFVLIYFLVFKGLQSEVSDCFVYESTSKTIQLQYAVPFYWAAKMLGLDPFIVDPYLFSYL